MTDNKTSKKSPTAKPASPFASSSSSSSSSLPPSRETATKSMTTRETPSNEAATANTSPRSSSISTKPKPTTTTTTTTTAPPQPTMTTNLHTTGKRAKEDKEWSRHYAALLEYYKEHDTCASSVVYECDLTNMGDDGGNYHYSGKLGRWLDKQKQCKKGNCNTNLLPEREAKLQLLVDEGK